MEKYNKDIFENGIDFLEKSLEEFKESPKFSVLHFAVAVEILLKARLVQEHWSLVVQQNANKTKYIKGDFQSVSLDEAVKRLKEIVGEHISDIELKSFKKMASHRNRVVHFCHGDFTEDSDGKELKKIIKEQCECWFYLKNIFTKRWSRYFEEHLERFESLDWKMRKHWEYLSTVYERVKPELDKSEKEGARIGLCRFCNYQAVPFQEDYENYSSGNCLVCNWRNTKLEIQCDCGENIIFENDGFETCESCGKKYEPQDLYSLINDLGYDTTDWKERITPANCSFCDGYHTVACFHEEYICTSCLEIFENIEQCDYCGEYCSGDMSDSGWKGCAICDGSAE